MRWLRRVVYWLRFSSRERELREELALHRDLLTADLERRGLSPAAADAAAHRAMGNETYMREESRGVWLAPHVDAFLQGWRHSWRGLRRSPVFTLVAVLSLALGIGANATIFSLLHGLLLARLPIAHPTELVELRRNLGITGVNELFSRVELDALRSGPMPLTMFSSTQTTLDIDGASSSASLDVVDGNYFDLLGIQAQLGRLIGRSDDDARAPFVVISDRVWRDRLNGDPRVIGRTIRLDDHPVTIVGVTAPGFAGLRFPGITDIEISYHSAVAVDIVHAAAATRSTGSIVGRRRAHQSLERARDDLSIIWRHCCAAGENIILPKGVPSASHLDIIDVSRGIPFFKLDIRGEYSKILIALMAGVALLLLAACANVANLLLARASARAGELAVRLALGASRRRMVAQLVIESLQLSLLGAIAGLVLARWSLVALSRAPIGGLSAVLSPSLDAAVIAFTTIVSVVSGIVFGVVPAVRVMRDDLIAPLKQGGRRSARTRGRLDRALVTLQVALALLLVSGASLLVQTLRNLQAVDLGFDADQRVAISIETRRTPYARDGMTRQMADEILRRVRAIPGIRAAALGMMVPMYGGRGVSDNVTVRGAAPVPDGDPGTAFSAVSSQYFAALGIPIRAGHDIDAWSAPDARARDVVVNERFVKKFFAGGNPIGRIFEDSDDGNTLITANRIVGIVGDARIVGPRRPAMPMYFVPPSDNDWHSHVLVAHITGTPAGIGAEVTRAIRSVAPGIGLGDPTLLSASVAHEFDRERMSAALASLFGMLALCLVAVGLYGVMLYRVTERTREIGIRMALGARTESVVGLVLRETLTIVGAGVIAGVPLAMLAGRAVASQLFGIAPYSVAALLVAAGSLATVAIAASLVPVRRAISVDPLTALRAE